MDDLEKIKQRVRSCGAVHESAAMLIHGIRAMIEQAGTDSQHLANLAHDLAYDCKELSEAVEANTSSGSQGPAEVQAAGPTPAIPTADEVQERRANARRDLERKAALEHKHDRDREHNRREEREPVTHHPEAHSKAKDDKKEHKFEDYVPEALKPKTWKRSARRHK